MAELTRKTQMTTGGPVFVYVDEEADKIVRITPMDLDDTDLLQEAEPVSHEAGGLRPPWRAK